MHTDLFFSGRGDDEVRVDWDSHEPGTKVRIYLGDYIGGVSIYMPLEQALDLSARLSIALRDAEVAVPDPTPPTLCDHCQHEVESDGDRRESIGGEYHLEWWQHVDGGSSFCSSVSKTAGALVRAEVNGTRRVDGVKMANA
jgi:hypothetical protein